MALQGRWRGYWEQITWGRQPMRLTLRLGDGEVDGEGDDIIGPFTFQGQYDTHGHVTMTKQYIGRHQVLYDGTYDGEGTIFGTWSIGTRWRGPFVIRLEAADRQGMGELASEQIVATGQRSGRHGRTMEPVE